MLSIFSDNVVPLPVRVPTVVYALRIGDRGVMVYPMYSVPSLNISFRITPQFAAWRGEPDPEQQLCMRDGPQLSRDEAQALEDYVATCEQYQRSLKRASDAVARYKDIY